MSLRSLGTRVCLAILGAIVVALLLGAVLGQPVLFSFVETGSMSPTLEPGDGFVAIPSAIAGPIDSGDIVVFRAERLDGGGLVTHRVVGETNQGYITQGDANTFTDQADSEPPVKDAQIVAVALQVGGAAVVLPHFGDAVGVIHGGVSGFQTLLSSVLGIGLHGGKGFAIILLVVTMGWYAIEVWRERSVKRPVRSLSRETAMSGRTIVLGLTVLLVVGATMAMVVPSGNTGYSVVSAEFDSPGPRVIPIGETETATHPVGNGGVLPVVVFLEPSDSSIDVSPSRVSVPSRSVTNATVSLTAPPETGYYRHFVTEHRYLGVLPAAVIEALYRVHPWVPVVVIDAVIALPYYLVAIQFVGTGSVRLRRRDRGKPLRIRTRRLLRRLY